MEQGTIEPVGPTIKERVAEAFGRGDTSDKIRESVIKLSDEIWSDDKKNRLRVRNDRLFGRGKIEEDEYKATDKFLEMTLDRPTNKEIENEVKISSDIDRFDLTSKEGYAAASEAIKLGLLTKGQQYRLKDGIRSTRRVLIESRQKSSEQNDGELRKFKDDQTEWLVSQFGNNDQRKIVGLKSMMDGDFMTFINLTRSLSGKPQEGYETTGQNVRQTYVGEVLQNQQYDRKDLDEKFLKGELSSQQFRFLTGLVEDSVTTREYHPPKL